MSKEQGDGHCRKTNPGKVLGTLYSSETFESILSILNHIDRGDRRIIRPTPVTGRRQGSHASVLIKRTSPFQREGRRIRRLWSGATANEAGWWLSTLLSRTGHFQKTSTIRSTSSCSHLERRVSLTLRSSFSLMGKPKGSDGVRKLALHSACHANHTFAVECVYYHSSSPSDAEPPSYPSRCGRKRWPRTWGLSSR